MPTPTFPPPHWRQPRWLAKAALSLALILGGSAYALERYRIGIDDQKRQCLPPYTVWLIDTHRREVARADTIAFHATDAMQPWFGHGQTIIKRAAGIPGDVIAVTATTTTVNGHPVGEGLALAKTLQRPSATLERTLTVPSEQVWMMGDTRDSFDSRYWGPLNQDRVIGSAYALW